MKIKPLCPVAGCDRLVDYGGYCKAHYLRAWAGKPLDTPIRRRDKPGTPLEDKFLARVNMNGPTPVHRPDLGPCWVWTGYIQKNGYGKLTVGPAKGQRCWLAHRLGWFIIFGEEPPGMFDHLCLNKSCVNPSHLEPEVSNGENQRRSWATGTRSPNPKYRRPACRHGHEYTPENTYWYGDARRCRACQAASNKRAYQRRRSTSS